MSSLPFLYKCWCYLLECDLQSSIGKMAFISCFLFFIWSWPSWLPFVWERNLGRPSQFCRFHRTSKTTFTVALLPARSPNSSSFWKIFYVVCMYEFSIFIKGKGCCFINHYSFFKNHILIALEWFPKREGENTKCIPQHSNQKVSKFLMFPYLNT